MTRVAWNRKLLRMGFGAKVVAGIVADSFEEALDQALAASTAKLTLVEEPEPEETAAQASSVAAVPDDGGAGTAASSSGMPAYRHRCPRQQLAPPTGGSASSPATGSAACAHACGRPHNATTRMCCTKCPTSHTGYGQRRFLDAGGAAGGASVENTSDYSTGYLVLRAPASLAHQLGYHRCSWPQLERALGAAPGHLAGRLSEHGVYLVAARSEEQRRRAWRGQHLVWPPARRQ